MLELMKAEWLYSKDAYELPIKSIRELVANAVIHRSYLVESKIQISIFDDRIESSSVIAKLRDEVKVIVAVKGQGMMIF